MGAGLLDAGIGKVRKWGVGIGPLAPGEEDLRGILNLLAQLGQSKQEKGDQFDAGVFQQRLSALPTEAQYTLREAIASISNQTRQDQADQPMLLKLAEHVAIRFALESYERGEVRVDAVRQMLDRMGKEIHSLRKVLVSHEEKLAAAGVAVEPHVEQLSREFWAEMPENNRQTVLLSKDAWCVPPPNARTHVEDLNRRGDKKTANQILFNYVCCIASEDPDARRNAATGIPELAELYVTEDGGLLIEGLRQVGTQLAVEPDTELQSLIRAAFVRLSQEAAAKRSYAAMQQVMSSLESIEAQRPGSTQAMRPRLGIESRLHEFIEEALRAESVPHGLEDLLRLMPSVAAEHITARFGRCGFREDCHLLAEIFGGIGSDGVAYLRETLRSGPPAQAVETVGLLSSLDVAAVEELLPKRLGEWQRSLQDRAVRQLSAGGSAERGHLLLAIFDVLDPLIKPLALDEIGMSGDRTAAPRLLALVQSDETGPVTPYLRLKAVETLGRLRAGEAVESLRKIVSAKQLWRWIYPSEMRIVAAQALERIDADWFKEFLPKSGISEAELSIRPLDPDPDSSCLRQRRYPRNRLLRPVSAVTTNLRENCTLEIKMMNLSGGIAVGDRLLASGTLIALRLNPGMRSIRAQAFVRDARTRAFGFEITEMDLEERAKLRKFLLELFGPEPASSPDNRSRRRGPVLVRPH